MKEKTSNFIFLISIITFFILTPAIVFYARGYRIDWKKFKIIKTGAIYINSIPKNANIYIDHEYKGFSPKLIKSLKPNDYLIEVQLNNSQTWYKTLSVYPSTVTEIKSILFLPDNLSPETIIEKDNILNYWPSLDWKKYIYLDRENNLWLYNKINKEQYIVATTTNETIITWSEDNNKFLIEDSYDTHLFDTNSKQLFNIEPTTDFQQIKINPLESNKVLLLSNRFLYEFDSKNNSFTPILDKNLLTYTIINNQIYYILESNKILYRYDLDKKESFQISLTSFEDASIKTQLTVQNNKIVALNEQKLYLFNDKERKFNFIDDNVFGFSIASDSKIIIQKDKELFIYYPTEKKGEKQFITRYSQKINNSKWFNNENSIIFTLNNEIKITEIDTRNHLNVAFIANVTPSTFLYLDNKNNDLYFLNEKGLNKLKLIK